MVLVLGLFMVVVMSVMGVLILWQEGHWKFIPLAVGTGLSLAWLVVRLAS